MREWRGKKARTRAARPGQRYCATREDCPAPFDSAAFQRPALRRFRLPSAAHDHRMPGYFATANREKMRPPFPRTDRGPAARPPAQRRWREEDAASRAKLEMARCKNKLNRIGTAGGALPHRQSSVMSSGVETSNDEIRMTTDEGIDNNKSEMNQNLRIRLFRPWSFVIFYREPEVIVSRHRE